MLSAGGFLPTIYVSSFINLRDTHLQAQNSNPTLLGGQAVIEGVMMRFEGSVATAVRRADGTIAVKKEKYTPLAERHTWLKLPILRGAVGLVEMLGIGVRALNYSAEVALLDAEPQRRRDSKGKRSVALGLTVAISLVAGVALFFVAPLYIATEAFTVDQQPLLFNLLAGGIRVVIFISYLLFLTMMKDVKRLFQYHGAEHKAVFAMEKGKGLDIASCRTQSRFHPRCGTSFLLVVLVVAIVFFAVLDGFVIAQYGPLTLGVRLLTHLPLIPLVMGVAYEFIRFSARHSTSAIGRLAIAPGLWLQRITTREPDNAQLEVAIAALRAALGNEPTEEAIEQAVIGQAISVN
jgi:uncharacterized protein YqhQ